MKVASIFDDDNNVTDVPVDTKFGEHEATIEKIKLCDMTVYPEAQRRFRPTWASKLAGQFDPNLVGIITLNQRVDGSYAVVNGQHRRAAGQMTGYDETAFTCHVYHHLNTAEEAALFLALNNTRNIPSIDTFLVGVLKGDATAVTVASILQEFDLEAGTGNHNAFMAIKAANNIVNDSGAVTGPEAFRTALDVVTQAWRSPNGTGRKGFLNGFIVHGIALMALMYGPRFEPKHMADRLRKFGDPQVLIGTIRGRKTTHQGSAATVARVVLTEIYNKGLGSNRQLETVSTNRRPIFSASEDE